MASGFYIGQAEPETEEEETPPSSRPARPERVMSPAAEDVHEQLEALLAGQGETRDERRSRRHRLVRSRSVSIKQMTKRTRELGRLLNPDANHRHLPTLRSDCENAPRPCPFVSCKWHMFLDVSPRTGNIKLNFPDLEPDEIPETCVLDVAARGGETLEEVGRIINITRERIRQIEVKAMALLRDELARFVDGEERRPVRVIEEDDQDEEPDSEDAA
jgi:hypothetical protein